jgi:hypothetical protein
MSLTRADKFKPPVAKEESYFLPKKAGQGTLPEQLTSRSEGAALMQKAP